MTYLIKSSHNDGSGGVFVFDARETKEEAMAVALWHAERNRDAVWGKHALVEITNTVDPKGKHIGYQVEQPDMNYAVQFTCWEKSEGVFS